MLTTDFASDVAAYVLHEAGEGRCVLRRQQEVVVVTEKAHTKQLHIEALQSTRKHADYQRVDSLGGTEQETAVDTAAGHKEDRPLFRLITNWE